MKLMLQLMINFGLLAFGSIILLAACSKSTVPDDDIRVNPVPTPSVTITPVASIPLLNLGQSDDTDFLEKEVANLRAIPLETTDDCLIGQITNLFIVGDTLVVVDGDKSKQIFLFDTTGKFLSKISHFGEGPGEYGSITYALVGHEGITIHDWLTASYISYDYSGNVISSSTFHETSPESIMPQNDSTLLTTYASYFEHSPFALQWLEGDSVVATAFPYSIKRSEIAPSMFRLSDSEIGLHIPTVDTIYSITGRQIVPKYKLGLISDDEAQQWRRKTANMNIREKREYRFNGKDVPADFIRVYPMNDAFVITHQKGVTSYISVVDRETLQSCNYLQSCMAPAALYLPPCILSASGNTLVGFMADDYISMIPDGSRAFIERHFSEQDQEILKNHDYENDNPIVWLMELK